MNTTIKNENGRQTVYFEGRLDTAAAPQANRRAGLLRATGEETEGSDGA